MSDALICYDEMEGTVGCMLRSACTRYRYIHTFDLGSAWVVDCAAQVVVEIEQKNAACCAYVCMCGRRGSDGRRVLASDTHFWIVHQLFALQVRVGQLQSNHIVRPIRR